VRLTTRLCVVATVVLALAAVACAGTGSQATGPGGSRPRLDVADSGAVQDGNVAADSTVVVAQDSTAVAQDSVVAADDTTAFAPAPDDPSENPSSGYVVAY
jgi:hypothetical protein